MTTSEMLGRPYLPPRSAFARYAPGSIWDRGGAPEDLFDSTAEGIDRFVTDGYGGSLVLALALAFALARASANNASSATRSK